MTVAGYRVLSAARAGRRGGLELGSVGTLRGMELGGGWSLRLGDPGLTTRKALSSDDHTLCWEPCLRTSW